MALHILGIRHHGVGSARQVLDRLVALRPDLVLVEGPPDMDGLLKHVGDPELVPPVALLGYNKLEPQQASFYPFAEFSPEWQAIKWANQHQVPVRMLDLTLQMAFQRQKNNLDEYGEVPATPAPRHPMDYLAELDGYENSETWWEARFESGHSMADSATHFEAVMEAMTALRQANLPSALDEENVVREAWMRQIIRQAQRDLYTDIVVICGAWHAPALAQLIDNERLDEKIIKQAGKSKIAVEATWIPWTNTRLSMQSGYGAGIQSPGWSAHRWKFPDDEGAIWLTSVARLFRTNNMDTATAHVIEATRLAQTLATLRMRPMPTLDDLHDATASVMCMGDAVRLDWIRDELVVGRDMGSIPSGLPKLPLVADFEAVAKTLKLALNAEPKTLTLDLRTEFDQRRSVLLHRMNLLGVKWAKPTHARSKGTFKEVWMLQWEPERWIDLIDRGIWGNTVETASTNYMLDKIAHTHAIGPLAQLLQVALPAAMDSCIGALMARLQSLAAIASDVFDLMTAFVPLFEIRRYGQVRSTDEQTIAALTDGLLSRICVGLPFAASGLDDTASQQLFGLMRSVHEGVRLLAQPEQSTAWHDALYQLSHRERANPLILGCTVRLLLDARLLDDAAVATRFSYALSAGQTPDYSAGWLEGFLSQSGMVLLYDDTLWSILYQWVAGLEEAQFVALLPVMRRTFAKYEPAERQKIGEKAKKATNQPVKEGLIEEHLPATHPWDTEQATPALRTVLELLA
jgi:Family of unknown function (DUF5682)